MDIVDAQVHANMLGTEATLAVMDALGVQGVLFDEYQRTDGDGAAQTRISTGGRYLSPNRAERRIRGVAPSGEVRLPDAGGPSRSGDRRLGRDVGRCARLQGAAHPRRDPDRGRTFRGRRL